MLPFFKNEGFAKKAHYYLYDTHGFVTHIHFPTFDYYLQLNRLRFYNHPFEIMCNYMYMMSDWLPYVEVQNAVWG